MCTLLCFPSLFLNVMIPQCQWKNSNQRVRYWMLPYPERKFRVFTHHQSPASSSFEDDEPLIPPSTPKPQLFQLDYSEELFDVDPQPREVVSGDSNPRSLFGPNGQYIRESPCPSCRGRGYTPCEGCGIERSRADCRFCTGTGMILCLQCQGDCVVWEESIDEKPWEKARSISLLKVKDDEEVDKLDIKLDVRRKSKRVYQSPSPEVNLKISRSLKSLNAKTGLFSNRMKIIHQDPVLHAQRVASVKKAKGTPAARRHASEVMKNYFRDPENRRKRSISMKGVKFFCSNCGREGHRSYYCPEVLDELRDRRFRCRICGEKGHNKRTCVLSKKDTQKNNPISRNHHCTVCGQSGHNIRTCPLRKKEDLTANKAPPVAMVKRICTCHICLGKGHNTRTCPLKKRSINAVSRQNCER